MYNLNTLAPLVFLPFFNREKTLIFCLIWKPLQNCQVYVKIDICIDSLILTGESQDILYFHDTSSLSTFMCVRASLLCLSIHHFS